MQQEGDLRREMFNRAGGEAVPLNPMSNSTPLNPYENWDGKLQPDNGGLRPQPQQMGVRYEDAYQGTRTDIFEGVSARARTTVYQFIWELKLRVFTEGEILDQELRKDPKDRVYLKLLQPTSMDTLTRNKRSDNPVLRALHYVDGTMPEFSHFARRNIIFMFIDALLRGAGQVMMCNNPIGGAIAIGAIFAANAWVGCMACFGLVCSTVTAYMLGVNRAAWQGGLFGYNGLLLGAACGALMAGPWNALVLPIVFVGATFTSILNLAFGNMLAPVFGAPPLALAFVFMTWIILGAMYSWQHFRLSPGMVPNFPGPTPGPTSFNVNEAFQAWMRGVRAIYFAGTVWSGCMLVFAMCFFSRISAIMMCCGSMVGLLSGWMVGANVNDIYAGNWSYDAALSAIGIGGLFYVISWKVSILAMMAAFFASWLRSGLVQWLSPAGLPSLNLGFDLTVIIFVMIQFSLSGIAVIPLAKISQPETHYFKTRTLAATLKALAEIERMKEEQRNEREANYEQEMLEMELEQKEHKDDIEAQYKPVDSKKAAKDAKEYDSDDLSL